MTPEQQKEFQKYLMVLKYLETVDQRLKLDPEVADKVKALRLELARMIDQVKELEREGSALMYKLN